MIYFNRILKKNNFLGISWCYCFPQRIIKTETNIRNVVVFYSNKTTTKIPREEQFFVICTLCLCWNWSRTLKKFNLEYLSLRIHNIWTIRLFADLWLWFVINYYFTMKNVINWVTIPPGYVLLFSYLIRFWGEFVSKEFQWSAKNIYK